MTNTTEGSDSELHAGQMLGRYELLMPIAKGGMGNVWAARLKGTRGFRKLVAVKTILHNPENDQLEQMFYREAVLASQIHHPNVAETLELGEHEGTLYLVMELISGESLRYLLRQAHAEGGIPLPVCVNLIGQVCHGLAAAHDLRDESGERVGLVHRDISPPNVLVTDGGMVKIVDFGVATTASSRTFGSGEIKGKISYLAPEQLRSEALDERVDVFTTGILLYLLTVRKHPFRAATETGTIAKILSSEPARPPSMTVDDYPPALEAVLLRALEKDRDRRYPSATAFLEALEEACPQAFGPRADERVGRYVQDLLKDRLLERRATLRLAEEWAETSSARHSAYSLPVVTASAPPRPASQRGAWVGLGGVLTGMGVAAAALTLHMQAAKGIPEASERAASASLTRAALPSPRDENEPRRAANAPTITEAELRAADLGAAQAPASAARTSSWRGRREREKELESPLVSGTLEPRSESSEAAASAQVGAGTLAGGEPPPSKPTVEGPQARLPPVALSALTPGAAAGGAPRLASVPRVLASKSGQARLLTNLNDEASRVQLPPALARMGQTFSATVNVCVSERGQVTKVNILRSAGPALDPQIPGALSRWQYRPLMENGRPTPFCYVLNYEVRAR